MMFTISWHDGNLNGMATVIQRVTSQPLSSACGSGNLNLDLSVEPYVGYQISVFTCAGSMDYPTFSLWTESDTSSIFK